MEELQASVPEEVAVWRLTPEQLYKFMMDCNVISALNIVKSVTSFLASFMRVK